MKKWLWRIILVTSSCLLVAVVVLWVSSVSHYDHIAREQVRPSGRFMNWQHVSLTSQANRIWLIVVHQAQSPNSMGSALRLPKQDSLTYRHITSHHENHFALEVAPWVANTEWWNRLGFICRYSEQPGQWFSRCTISVPHWFLALIFSLPLLIQSRRWYVKRRRHRLGCCQTCGYDLRASVDRCPECGTVIAAGLPQ